MSEVEAVDAAQTEQNEAQAPADDGAEMIPKSEAQKAFERRDKALSRARELEAKLAEIEQAQADAERAKAEEEGDLRKQLELIQADKQKAVEALESLQSELKTERARMRSNKIESGILSAVADPAHNEAVLAMFRGMAPQLDDGEADADKVSKAALKAIQKIAPQFFEKQKAAPPVGLFPSGTESGTPTGAIRRLQQWDPNFKKLL